MNGPCVCFYADEGRIVIIPVTWDNHKKDSLLLNSLFSRRISWKSKPVKWQMDNDNEHTGMLKWRLVRRFHFVFTFYSPNGLQRTFAKLLCHNNSKPKTLFRRQLYKDWIASEYELWKKALLTDDFNSHRTIYQPAILGYL